MIEGMIVERILHPIDVFQSSKGEAFQNCSKILSLSLCEKSGLHVGKAF